MENDRVLMFILAKPKTMENDRGLTKVKRKHSKHIFLTLTHISRVHVGEST